MNKFYELKNRLNILPLLSVLTMAIAIGFTTTSVQVKAGPFDENNSGSAAVGNNTNGNATTGNGVTDRETLSEFDWFLDSLTYDAFEGVYFYEKHPLAQDVTDKSQLEGSWDMVIYHHPDATSVAPVPLFRGKEIGKLYIENIGGDDLKISFDITDVIPDVPGDTNPVDEETMAISGFWNQSGIINANIEGGGSLDIYSFFTLPDGKIHATGMLNIMTADKSIYYAYLGLNKAEDHYVVVPDGRTQAAKQNAPVTEQYDNTQSMENSANGQSEFAGSFNLSNEEIAELARKKCGAPFASIDSIDPDGTLNIQLYEVAGGHTATWDWYSINPKTLKGTNILGEEIDLNPIR